MTSACEMWSAQGTRRWNKALVGHFCSITPTVAPGCVCAWAWHMAPVGVRARWRYGPCPVHRIKTALFSLWIVFYYKVSFCQSKLLDRPGLRVTRMGTDTHAVNTLKALPPHRRREQTGSDSTMAPDRPGAHVCTVRKGDGEVADIKTGEVAEEFKCQP